MLSGFLTFASSTCPIIERVDITSTFLFIFLLKGLNIMKESKFQKSLIDEIKTRFPGSYVLKNDSSYIQGVPDLLVLYKKKWAMLEVKKNSKAHHQPNQDYYIGEFNKMSYASFISPENKEEVLNDLERSFKVRRKPCIPRSK